MNERLEKWYKKQARKEANYRARVAKNRQKRLFDIMCKNASLREKKKKLESEVIE